MNKSKIEKRLPEPQHSKEQKADATSVSPAFAKPTVVRSPNLDSVSKSFIEKIQDLQLPLSQKSLLSTLLPSEFLIDVSPLNQDTKFF